DLVDSSSFPPRRSSDLRDADVAWAWLAGRGLVDADRRLVLPEAPHPPPPPPRRRGHPPPQPAREKHATSPRRARTSPKNPGHPHARELDSLGNRRPRPPRAF